MGEAEPTPKKKENKYEFTEDELVELKRIITDYQKRLFKHPEGPDYIAVKQLNDYLTRRLTDIAWKRYKAEKGIE